MDAAVALGRSKPQLTLITRLFVVGLGNIGSQVVPMLASLPHIERVGLVDFDRYDGDNLAHQRLAARDVGHAKARVQARWLRAMRPGLLVTAHVSRFEHLPLGELRGSVILGCVDSRAARQAINRAATALGIAWIDAALAREGNVRARAYLPGHACLECGWGPDDYALLEQRLPCQGAAATTAPTRAAIELGAIAAGLQVALCRRLIEEAHAPQSLADRQWFFDLPSGRGWVSSYGMNQQCRLHHEPWAITRLGRGSVDMSLREALALAGPDAGEACLSAPGMDFLLRQRCPGCRRLRRVRARLSGRIAQRACDACGETLLASAIDIETGLGARNTSRAVLREPLARRGFVPGDIVALSAGGGGPRHFQLA